MASMDELFWVFGYEWFRNAYLAGICAGLLCSVLGVFIVLRRSSLIGEGIAHLSFGGIALGLFLAVYPLYTALVLALIGTLVIYLLSKRRVVYSETAIGLLFSLGLAMGAVLASMAGGFNVDLFNYLFGSILTVSNGDFFLVAVLSTVTIGFVLVFFKELMLLTFDEQGARLAGIPVIRFELAFNILVAFTVVVSIKIVGTLLVSALLITPAASAMQFSRSFRGTVLSAMVLSILSVVLGLLISFVFDIPSGGSIVLVSIVVFIVCALTRLVPRSLKEENGRTTCDVWPGNEAEIKVQDRRE